MENANLKILAMGVCVLASTACTMAPVKKQALVGDSKLMETAREYKRTVQSVPEVQLQGASCTNAATAVKTHWDWKEAVVAADSCLKARDLKRAEDIGKELSIREPSAPWGPYFLASVARDRKELERALWMSELAMKRAPEVGVVHYLKGQILWNKKEYAAAVYCFEKSTEMDPTLIPAHLFLGKIYFRDQEYSNASRHFYAVLKIDPKHPVALTGLAESQLHDKNTRGALEAYQRLADAYPTDGQYLSRVAEIYEQGLNDIPQALITYKILKTQIQMSRIQKNVDTQIDSKIKELELATRKTRALASTEEKGSLVR